MTAFTTILVLLFCASCMYQVLALFLAWAFRKNSRLKSFDVRQAENFSLVKPVQAVNDGTLVGLKRLFEDLEQSGLSSEVYLCSREAAPVGLVQDFPGVTWLQVEASSGQNGKASVLAQAEPFWEGEIFVVSDADMLVEPGYVNSVLREFRDPQVGVVTCLYRSTECPWGQWGHLFEALCINDFAASVLVARRTEGVSFAMGSTMAIRRKALEDIGGFKSLEPFLADDYQLGNRAHKAGWEVRLAATVLETDFPGTTLSEALVHQYRWLVTSRVCRPSGHALFVLTQGLLWASILALISPGLGWKLLMLWFGFRCISGYLTARQLGSPVAACSWQSLFLPGKDLLYLLLWLASLFGQTVQWGGRTLRIDSAGRIIGSQAEVR